MAKGAIGEFFGRDTAGLPNWAWVLIVGAGIAAAYIVPKLLGNATGTSSQDAASTGTGTNASGLGLAIDPTTGLPYAVEGLVPSGGTAGTVDNNPPPVPTQTPGACAPGYTFHPSQLGAPVASGSYQVAGGYCVPNAQPKPKPKPKPGDDHDTHVTTPHQPPTRPTGHPAPQRFATAAQWPNPLGSLSGIASHYGISLQKIEQLNPGITNPNLIHPGEQIRIA